MRFLTYGMIILFAIPILVLGIYLGIGIYHGSENMHYFTQESFWMAFKHSLLLSSLSAFSSLVIGTILAKAFFTLKQKGLQSLYLLALTILFMIQPIMILTITKQIHYFTTLSALLQSATIATLHLIPMATLFWILMYHAMQTESLHIAHYLSSSRWSTYRYIIFPKIRNKIILAFLFLFILVFIDQEVPSILGYRTYTEELLSQMTLMEEMHTIVLSALPSFILVGILSFGLIFWFKKNPIYLSNTTSVLQSKSHELFGKTVLLVLYLSLVAMLLILMKTSLILPINSLFKNNIDVIFQTFTFAFVVSLCTLLLGISLHAMLQRYASTMLSIIWASLLLCYLLLPHSLISLSLLDIYQKVGIFSSEGDFFLFFIGYILVLLPIASLLLYLFSIQEKKDYFLDFFPVSVYHRWIKIIFPKQWIIWTIIFLILMTFTLNELSVSILLVPPGFETMIVKIYNLLHYGDKANIAFLSLIQLLFLMCCFVILTLLSKKALK